MKKNNTLTWILGIAVVAIILLEIYISDQTVTKTETALFGVIQFTFSLGFAWLLSRQNSKIEFEREQRKFAAAALRRIKEIESQTNHLVSRLNDAIGNKGRNHLHELDIARTQALSINETTQSSMLD